MSQRSRVVVGNWKMNGSLAANAALVATLRRAFDVDDGRLATSAVCVPFPYLAQVQSALDGSPIALGAQDVSEYAQGAFTGEVAASMLCDFGCRYVVVGHSERRTYFGDTDQRVALKADRAIDAGLVPIVCVGETLAEREEGRAEEIVSRQLDALLERIGAARVAGTLLAYEPVWAIGTGRTASPEQAQTMHAAMRRHVGEVDATVAARVKILYGGSVKGSNAASLFGCGDIDGALVGGAALVAEDFVAIAAAAGGAGRVAAAERSPATH